jgi:hypothetical protein
MIGNIEVLPLKKIRLDGGTQARERLNDQAVKDYCESYARGERLPPPVCFFDGKHYWLADGFQRVEAKRHLMAEDMDVEVRNGSQRDAVLYAAGANAEHGARRTVEDKRRAVAMILSDKEWRGRTDGWIAEVCRVSLDLIQRVRHDLYGEKSDDGPRTARDGRVFNKRPGPKPEKRKHKRRMQGREVLDFDKLRQRLGHAKQALEDIVRWNGRKASPRYAGMARKLTELYDEVKQWEKEIEKEKKAKEKELQHA